MATPEIKGFFSKEHSVLVFLICICFGWLYKNDKALQTILLQQAEIKADIKVITYQINNGKTPKSKLASFHLYRCEREPQFQKANTILACYYRNKWEHLQYLN